MKMKMIWNCLCLTGIFFVFGCGQSDDVVQKTSTGFDYQWHRHEGKNTPSEGDHVFFEASMYSGDSLIHNSSMSPSGREHVQIKDVPDEYAYFKPLMELLRQMGPGDSVSLWYPTDSMPNRQGAFQNIDVVRYDMKVEEIMDTTAYRAFMQEEKARMQAEMEALQVREAEVEEFVSQIYNQYKAGDLDDQMQETDSGLKYVIHENGNTGVTGESGDIIEAQYYGILESTGEMFDNSFKRGKPFRFPLNRGSVIRGWDQGFSLLEKGTKATLFIPYTLAYGKAGNPPAIPEEADLIFYVELEDIIKS